MTVCFAELSIGSNYSRKTLAELWGYAGFQALAKGLVTPKGENRIILFVTEEKQSSSEQYKDKLTESILNWEGPLRHGGVERIIGAGSSGDEIHLFHRCRHHSDFFYFGRLNVKNYLHEGVGPAKFEFSLAETK